MPAVFINCVAILLCSTLGLLLKRRLPKRLLDALMEAMGLCHGEYALRFGVSGGGHGDRHPHQH